jgi:hypothetical protein
MFGFFEKKKGEVIDHWYALVPGFNTSGKEFYEAIEKELKQSEAPGLEMFRVDFAEGGVLSQQREYLRMTRERLVFDVCAAPFGTSFFFSCRFAEIPAVVKLWELLVLLIGLCAVGFWGLMIFTRILGPVGIILFPCFLVALIIVAIYEAWIRKETYYRHDTRLMYCDTVNAVVKAQVEETTGVKGIKLIRFMENCPMLNELYKPNPVALPKGP